MHHPSIRIRCCSLLSIRVAHSFRRSSTPVMNRVGAASGRGWPFHFWLAFSHLQGICQVCALQGPCLTRSLPSYSAWLTLVGLARNKKSFSCKALRSSKDFGEMDTNPVVERLVGLIQLLKLVVASLLNSIVSFTPVVLGSWQISLLGLRHSAWKFLQINPYCCF